MNNNKMYSGYRYPTPIISHTVWLYFRFTISFRDIEELLPVFSSDRVAIVMDGSEFLGIITKIDLINYLRRQYVP